MRNDVNMKKWFCTVYKDEELNIEAYIYQGIIDKIPNHFHDYYEIGYIDAGNREVICQHEKHVANKGSMVLFNPSDNHSCIQIDETALDYKGIHVQEKILVDTLQDLFEKDYPPYFSPYVINDETAVSYIAELHTLIVNNESLFRREELLCFLIDLLINKYSQPQLLESKKSSENSIDKICSYLNENYSKKISLDDLCKIFGYSKYYLLRLFTKQKGISPYNYLESIRINNAKQMLEKGISIVDVTYKAGFSHQSHFSNSFKKYMGMTPK